MTEPNFIILIGLDSGKTVLQKSILKVTENIRLKSKKKRSGPLHFQKVLLNREF